ncbi:MAG: EAST1 family heat-stable enterotoxin [Nitrosomonadales bacterium]|nr:EAST1 family heat-stable enterotoxin [Nitrosomonadales bacterium]
MEGSPFRAPIEAAADATLSRRPLRQSIRKPAFSYASCIWCRPDRC